MGVIMSDSQFRSFLELVNRIELPTSRTITDEARGLYEKACDLLLMYRGHPDVLMQALQLFVATGVRPYAYTGIALVLAAASYVSNGNHEPEGVEEALRWMEQAQLMAPKAFEIQIFLPLIYGSLKQSQKVRELLDTLRSHPAAKDNIRYALAEIRYWDGKNDIPQVKKWADAAFKIAKTDVQRLYVLNRLASAYMMKRMTKEALALYAEVVKLDPHDPWAWHNMSIMYGDLGDETNAGMCNDRALRIMNFGAAQQVRRSLMARWSKNRHPDILQELPPYAAPGLKSYGEATGAPPKRK
jgi:tetratricopeptide (TPR) repeat protein